MDFADGDATAVSGSAEGADRDAPLIDCLVDPDIVRIGRRPEVIRVGYYAGRAVDVVGVGLVVDPVPCKRRVGVNGARVASGNGTITAGDAQRLNWTYEFLPFRCADIAGVVNEEVIDEGPVVVEELDLDVFAVEQVLESMASLSPTYGVSPVGVVVDENALCEGEVERARVLCGIQKAGEVARCLVLGVGDSVDPTFPRSAAWERRNPVRVLPI